MQAYLEQAKFQNLSSLASKSEIQDEVALESQEATHSISESDVQMQEKGILSQYAELYDRNHDFIGWIKVPNTKIDYPVMLIPSEPEYYLHWAFDKTNSQSGTPFIGAGGTVDSDCLIVYGHNMKNRTMFGELSHYQDRNFWGKNKAFTFDTLYEHREYEVLRH